MFHNIFIGIIFLECVFQNKDALDGAFGHFTYLMGAKKHPNIKNTSSNSKTSGPAES